MYELGLGGLVCAALTSATSARPIKPTLGGVALIEVAIGTALDSNRADALQFGQSSPIDDRKTSPSPRQARARLAYRASEDRERIHHDSDAIAYWTCNGVE